MSQEERTWADAPCSGHLARSLRRRDEEMRRGRRLRRLLPRSLLCQYNSALALRTKPVLPRGEEINEHLLWRARALGFLGGVRSSGSGGTLSDRGKRERERNEDARELKKTKWGGCVRNSILTYCSYCFCTNRTRAHCVQYSIPQCNALHLTFHFQYDE